MFEEIIVDNFPKMGKDIATQVQEAQGVPYRINPMQNTPRHIIIKNLFNKDLEEIKKSQYTMNNAINEIKTLWRQQIVE